MDEERSDEAPQGSEQPLGCSDQSLAQHPNGVPWFLSDLFVSRKHNIKGTDSLRGQIYCRHLSINIKKKNKSVPG